MSFKEWLIDEIHRLVEDHYDKIEQLKKENKLLREENDKLRHNYQTIPYYNGEYSDDDWWED